MIPFTTSKRFINHTHHKQNHHQPHKQLGLMPNYAMRLDTTPICMWYHTSPRSSTHDATKTSLSTAIINDYMDITSDTTYDA